MHVVINGLMTRYTVSGKGPVVVMLHGWGDSMTTFTSLEKDLSKNYTIVKLDLPGFGGTQRPEKAFGVSDFVNFVAMFLDKTEFDDIFALIGHSNGGTIIIKGLQENSLTAKKIILLASAGIRSEDTIKKSLYKATAKAAKIPLVLLPRNKREQLRKQAYRQIGSDLHVVEGMEDSFKKVVSEDMIDYASQIENPTLLVYGDKDTATPVSYGKKYQDSMKNASLEIVPGAGHFLHQTDTRVVCKMIEDFLKS